MLCAIERWTGGREVVCMLLAAGHLVMKEPTLCLQPPLEWDELTRAKLWGDWVGKMLINLEYLCICH